MKGQWNQQRGDPWDGSSVPRAARTPGRSDQWSDSPFSPLGLQMPLKLLNDVPGSIQGGQPGIKAFNSFKPFILEQHHMAPMKQQL